MTDQMASPVAAAKKKLRSLVKQRLSTLSQDAVQAQSRCIFDTLKNHPSYKYANRISIYLSMPAAEVQTDAIVRDALSAGKQVFVPYLYKSTLNIPDTPSRIMDMVQLKNIHDYETLAKDKWNIPSIDSETVASRERILGNDLMTTLDLILVPGVAFDVGADGSIRRLGHGKGFYDFFLNRYFARAEENGGKGSSLRMLALGLDEQLLAGDGTPEIPMGQYDRKLHGVIVGSGRVIE